MKIFLSKLSKDLFLYKNKEILIGTKENKLKGTMLLPMVYSSNEILDLYRSNILVNQFIKGYYYPRIDKMESIRNKKIDNNQLVKYKELKQTLPKVIYKKPKLDMYQNFNTIFDMYEYWKLFQSTYGNMNFNMKVEKFNLFFNELLKKIKSTNQEIIITIQPSKLITTGRDNSFENYFYYLYKNNKLNTEELKNITFIFVSLRTKRFFKCKFDNPNIKEFNFTKFKKLSNILYKLSVNEDLSEEEQKELDLDNTNDENEVLPSNNEISKQIKNKINKSLDISNKSYNNLTTKETEIYDRISDTIDRVSEKYENVDDALDELEQEYQFMNDLSDLSDSKSSSTNSLINNTSDSVKASRESRLKDKQKEISFNGLTIDSVLNEYQTNNIVKEEMKVDAINEEIKTSTLKELDKSYVKYQKDKDMLKILSSFNNDPDFPIYVTSIEKENTSDAMNKKETLKIRFEDTNGIKHNVKIDIPIIIDNSFLYLNDGKKALSKQLTLLPIVKVKPNEIRFTNGESKMFMYRVGRKLSSNIDKLKKFLTKEIDPTNKDFKIMFGSNKGTNSKYTSTMEYDDISNFLISFKLKDFYLNFNREDSINEIHKLFKGNIDELCSDGEFLLGCDKNSLYKINILTEKILEINLDNNIRNEYETIFELISKKIEEYDENLYNTLLNLKPAKKFMYTQLKLTSETIPTIIVLGFYFGFEKVLYRYGIDYIFEEKKRKLTTEELAKYNIIQFNDGYLYYKSSPLRNSLLLNGLSEIPTREIKFSDLNSQEIYLDFFDMFFGSRNKSKGFKNFLDYFLDPITVDVLKSLKLPDNLLDVILYGNTLLENNAYTNINSMENYRLRSMEIINSYLHLILSDAVKGYKDQYKSGHTEARISVKQDQLLKMIIGDPIVDEYSILNPILEVEKLGSTNYKGISGTNLESAFTPQVRAYDKSMVGLLGMSSPDSNKVGVVRQLSYSPKIINNRGIIAKTEDVNDLDATNLFTAGELISSYTSIHADPQWGFIVEILYLKLLKPEIVINLLLLNQVSKYIKNIILILNVQRLSKSYL